MWLVMLCCCATAVTTVSLHQPQLRPTATTTVERSNHSSDVEIGTSALFDRGKATEEREGSDILDSFEVGLYYNDSLHQLADGDHLHDDLHFEDSLHINDSLLLAIFNDMVENGSETSVDLSRLLLSSEEVHENVTNGSGNSITAAGQSESSQGSISEWTGPADNLLSDMGQEASGGGPTSEDDSELYEGNGRLTDMIRQLFNKQEDEGELGTTLQRPLGIVEVGDEPLKSGEGSSLVHLIQTLLRDEKGQIGEERGGDQAIETTIAGLGLEVTNQTELGNQTLWSSSADNHLNSTATEAAAGVMETLERLFRTGRLVVDTSEQEEEPNSRTNSSLITKILKRFMILPETNVFFGKDDDSVVDFGEVLFGDGGGGGDGRGGEDDSSGVRFGSAGEEEEEEEDLPRRTKTSRREKVQQQIL